MYICMYTYIGYIIVCYSTLQYMIVCHSKVKDITAVLVVQGVYSSAIVYFRLF